MPFEEAITEINFVDAGACEGRSQAFDSTVLT